MQGETLDALEITEAGIPGDRRWALVDVETGHVVSAKNPRKWGAVLQCSAQLVGPDAIEIGLPDGSVVRNGDADADDRLSDLLGRRVRLADSAPTDRHYEMLFPDIDGVAPAEAIEANRTGEEQGGTMTNMALGLLAPPASFFDLTTLHLITSATLAQLDDDVRRFRPNVVVDVDGTGYIENEWAGRGVSLGAVAEAQVLMPTMRCVMTTLPQPGLDQDRGVLETLARDNRIDIPGVGTWACAGIYASVTTGGAVRVGDEVSLTS